MVIGRAKLFKQMERFVQIFNLRRWTCDALPCSALHLRINFIPFPGHSVICYESNTQENCRKDQLLISMCTFDYEKYHKMYKFTMNAYALLAG